MLHWTLWFTFTVKLEAKLVLGLGELHLFQTSYHLIGELINSGVTGSPAKGGKGEEIYVKADKNEK